MKWMFLAVPLALTACGAPEKGGGDSVTKEEARERADDGDTTDWCAQFGWYGDGICDDFCTKTDSDCTIDCPDENGGCEEPDPGPGPGPDPDPDPSPAPGEEGDQCGGIAGLPCADGLTCEQDPGMCGVADSSGTCVVSPDACDDVYDPVCGCDGQTYANSCEALGAGASVDHAGECAALPADTCGTIAGLTCPDGMVCQYDEGTCDVSDAAGTCVEQPDVCPENYDPVCGCDGQTYSNSCFALAGGTSVASQGECGAGDTCGTIAGLTCPDGQVCQYPEGMCNVSDLGGTCVPAPDVCPDVVDPVCGCDGKTYGSECEALDAGMTVDHAGACEDEETPCGGFAGQTCTDDEYCHFEPETFCDYADGQGVCKPRPDNCTFQVDPVCGCDGKTYDNECFAAMSGTGLFSRDACD